MRHTGLTTARINRQPVVHLGLLAVGFLVAGGAPARAADATYSSVAQHWASAWSHKQAAAATALYAADAEFVHATGERVVGQAAIGALLSRVLATNTPKIEMASVTSAQAGSVAWDSGTYRETITPVAGGATKSVHGCYLLVLGKDKSGNWLIKSQLWSEAN